MIAQPKSTSTEAISSVTAKKAINNELGTLTRSVTAGDLLLRDGEIFKSLSYYYTPPSPISLPVTKTLAEACLVLAENKISSAPIIDASGKMVGILDYRDLVTHVLQVLNDVPMDIESSVYGLADILAQHSTASVHVLSDIPTHAALVVVKEDAIVHDVIEEFVRAGVHRVVVVDAQDQFVGVVSQSTIAAYISGKFGLRKVKDAGVWRAGQKSVAEAGVIQTNVVSVEPSSTVMQALFLMMSESVSSVAILQGTKLAGSISMNEVKHILSEKGGWKRVFGRCDVAFKKDRIEQSDARFGEAVAPNYTIQASCTVIRAMEKMVATRSHRVWVVDESEHIVGLVSLSSLMKLLLA